MTTALQPKHLLLCICLFLGGRVFAQDNAKLYPPEKLLLELITNDTISHTVSYLPEAYQFSVKDKGDKHFILLKSGKQNYFLLDGTNRVYIPDPAQPTSKLLRIDSTSFIGDNFNMMAFLRKDTLYQYGGYGFWENRDFFSYYRPNVHSWEFLTGGDAMQSMYTFNYFDEKADKFFTIGRYSQDTHKSYTPAFHDSIYSYDLKSKRWSTLGKIADPDILKMNTLRGLIFSSPWGFGTCYLNEFRIMDFINNKIYALHSSAMDSLELYLKDRDSKFIELIFLRDTLFSIIGDQNSASVGKFKISKADIDLNSGIALYDPVTNSQATRFVLVVTPTQLILMVTGILAIISVISLYLARKIRPTNLNSAVISADNHAAHIQSIIHENSDGTSNNHPNLQSFFNSLNQVEQELLKEIITHTLQGKKMDTHEINKILGVSQKETEIQKTRRSMTITRINNLYTQTMMTNGFLIQRERDPYDKRAYLYSMPSELAKTISSSAF